MRRFETVEDLAVAIGLPVNRDRWGGAVGAFPKEADWAYRLSGLGLSGGLGAGWLVTRAFAVAKPASALIAYAVLDGKKSGRCLLLAQPWPEDVDGRALLAFRASDHWTGKHGDNGEASIEALDSWLRANFAQHVAG